MVGLPSLSPNRNQGPRQGCPLYPQTGTGDRGGAPLTVPKQGPGTASGPLLLSPNRACVGARWPALTHHVGLRGDQGAVQPGQAAAPAVAAAQAGGSRGASRADAELPVLDQPQPRVVELLVLRGQSGRAVTPLAPPEGLAEALPTSSCPHPAPGVWKAEIHGQTFLCYGSAELTVSGQPQPRPQTCALSLLPCTQHRGAHG